MCSILGPFPVFIYTVPESSIAQRLHAKLVVPCPSPTYTPFHNPPSTALCWCDFMLTHRLIHCQSSPFIPYAIR